MYIVKVRNPQNTTSSCDGDTLYPFSCVQEETPKKYQFVALDYDPNWMLVQQNAQLAHADKYVDFQLRKQLARGNI